MRRRLLVRYRRRLLVRKRRRCGRLYRSGVGFGIVY